MLRTTILLVLALFLGGVQQASACKCVRDPEAPPEGSEIAISADMADSTAVFSGRVTRIESRVRLFLRLPIYWFKTRGGRELTDEEEYRIFRRRVQLAVEEPFKGTASNEVVLYTGWGGGDCGYGFQSGSCYLVYASDYNDGLYTGICSATKPVESAAGEIAILRRLAISIHHRPRLSSAVDPEPPAQCASGPRPERPPSGFGPLPSP